MTNTPLDELGPVDYVVVEFPAGAKNFTGEMAAEPLKLVDAGSIRVIDVLILDKDEDGSVEALRYRGARRDAVHRGQVGGAAGRRVDHPAACMEPGS